MKWFALCGAIIISLFLSIYLVQGRSSPHLLAENCQTCHLASESITKDNAHILRSSQEILCDSCHPNASTASHPSGFIPNRALPEVYKLNWQEKLTCSTCHDIHGDNHGLMVTPLTGREYCLSCHEQSFFDKMKDLGTSLFISGHTVANNEPFSEQIDSFTVKCIECHSKEVGSLNVTLVGNSSISHSGGRVNHPVGRDYKTAEAYGGYRPMHLVNKRIALPEGKVSCISCHKAYSERHGANIFDKNERISLCESCHDI